GMYPQILFAECDWYRDEAPTTHRVSYQLPWIKRSEKKLFLVSWKLKQGKIYSRPISFATTLCKPVGQGTTVIIFTDRISYKRNERNII
ncbi:unnamed protein product, partial [Allacma fusca]